MTTTQATVWIVGDSRHADFVSAAAWLTEWTHCECYVDPAAALAINSSRGPECDPHAILLVQSRPGQFTATDVERLHAAAPLARLIAWVGPWCEGELRSGRPWPGVVRIPWRAWHLRLPAEMNLSGPDGPPLPRIATQAEHALASAAAVAAHKPLRGAASVRTNSLATFDAIADALNQLGMKSAQHRESETPPVRPDLIIGDGWEAFPSSEQGRPPSLLLLHFPRPDDIARVQSLGISAVVAQPLLLADLAAAIDSVGSFR